MQLLRRLLNGSRGPSWFFLLKGRSMRKVQAGKIITGGAVGKEGWEEFEGGEI